MPSLNCISLKTFQPVKMPGECVLCLGNFDGVHIAHRALLSRGVQLRASRYPGAACGVFCFYGLSTDTLLSEPVPHLCTDEDRLKRFRDEGMEYAILADFPELMNYTPERFLDDVLRDACHCVAAVCGFNYRFGKNGDGTPETLAHSGLPVEVVPPVLFEDSPVSSTRIRNLISDGNVREAGLLLSVPYGFSSPVIHGKALGRKLGFPTLNQSFPPRLLIPKHGVYVSEALIDGKIYRGVSNVGLRPTVETGAPVNCETYLIDYDGADLYRKTVPLSLLAYLREERKFPSPEELRKQIEKDVLFAKSF